MKLDHFITHPVRSTVISIFIILLGILGLVGLPITQYPDIAPPTIQVQAFYQGANAQTVMNSVVAPLEEQINGVEGMDYISSSATNTGSASITITFKMGTDPDMAAVNVQNRVTKATSLLPAEVVQAGIITQKRQGSTLLVFSVVDTEGRYTPEFIQNYAHINLVPLVQRVNGVGEAKVFAGSYAMRIWLDPEKMSNYGLVPTDISRLLAEQNIEAAPGTIGERDGNTFQYTLRYRGRLQEVSEFENMIIKSSPAGNVIRLSDVARIELGSELYAFNCNVDGHQAVACMVSQTAGSNATQIIKEIEDVLQKAQKDMPQGLKIRVAQNVNDFLYASIHEVIKTLLEAFVLVFLVVFLFLQDFRSTLIPAITIPVSLIGTFFVLYLMGFTINLLTLSALVLAIASVVDDAIVVVEGVHAKFDQGYSSSKNAAIDAMRELGGAIVSITLVLMAVFIPVSFLEGTSGAFYRQFGLTMAIAIGFSALNALTLSPALCALLLKPHQKESSIGERIQEAQKTALTKLRKKYSFKSKGLSIPFPPLLTTFLLVIAIVMMLGGGFTSENFVILLFSWITAILGVLGLFSSRFIDAFNCAYEKVHRRYERQVEHFIARPYLSMGVVVVATALLVFFIKVTPTTLVPTEDTGTLLGMVSMPPGTSQDKTEETLRQVEKIVMASPLVETTTVISGFSFIGGQGPSYGMMFIKLKDWSQRNPISESATMVFVNLLLESQKSFKDAQVLFFAPPMISGYGISNGFSLNLQDRTGGDLTTLQTVAEDFIKALEERPEIQTARTNFNTKFPQFLIDIDVAQCKRAGISPTEVLNTLQGYYGGTYSSNFNRFGKIYRVMVQGDYNHRSSYESLYKVKVRNGKGEMAPITEFITLTPMMGPDNITRFNLFTSVSITGNPATGYTSGEAIRAIEEVAQTHLPIGYSYEYSGITREEQKNSGSTTAFVFLLCFVFIYLLLAAQYESYFLPLAVLFSVPLGLVGSFLFIYAFGSLGMLPGVIGNILGEIFGEAQNNIYVQISLIMLMGLLAKNAILIIEFALEHRKRGASIREAAFIAASARFRPILMTSLTMIIGLLPLMFAFGVGAKGSRSLGITAIGGMLIGMLLQIYIVPTLFRIFLHLQEKITPIEKEEDE